MRMFDYVNFEMKCPKCGHMVKGFQSKDGKRILETVEYTDVNNFYKACDKCGFWIEFYNYKDRDELLSLIDGALVTVELSPAKTRSQREWKKQWLKKARFLLKYDD